MQGLAFAVEAHLRSHSGQGQMFFAPLDCVFTQFDVVEPDLLVVTDDQRAILTEKHVQGVPALVVEILSDGTRRVDQRVKRDLYDRAGVREYWVIDPDANRLAVHRRAAGGRLTHAADLSHIDALTTPLLPGFALSLREYFA